jgi:hypothetical protein
MTGEPSPLGRYFASWSERLLNALLVLSAMSLSVLQFATDPPDNAPTNFLFGLAVLTWIFGIVAVSRLWVIPVTAIEPGGIRRPFAVVQRKLAWEDITDIVATRRITGRYVVVKLREGGHVKLNQVPHTAVPALRSYLGVDGSPAKRGSWWLVSYAVSGGASSAVSN